MGFNSTVKRFLRGRVFANSNAQMSATPAGSSAAAEADAVLSPVPDFAFRVAVYFADSLGTMYQIRQWYGPLRELSKRHGVVVIARRADTAQAIAKESGLHVTVAIETADIETFLQRQHIDVVMYVNNAARNFQMFRDGSARHVFICHGESDKKYMSSGQIKAYDFAFVAGDAARERLAAALSHYDVDERTIPIGRPQADFFIGDSRLPDDDRTVVFYAPTWEGDRPSMSYGSVESHGVPMITSLIATGEHRIVYRPHPLSGKRDAQYRKANDAIIAALERANRQDPAAHHVYDQSPELTWQIREPDIMVTDVSAMLYDRLATGKPLLVTRPIAEGAAISDTGYLSEGEWLHIGSLPHVAQEIDRVINDPDARAALKRWSQHYFGDTSPGVPTQRFLDAVDTLLAAADRDRAQ